MNNIYGETIGELRQKFSEFVTSDESIDILFDLVYGFDNAKEVKLLNSENDDISLRGFINFMRERNLEGSRFSEEIRLFIEELDSLYSSGINDCKPALEKLVGALWHDCARNGKADRDSVIIIHTALFSVGVVEISKYSQNKVASGVLTIAAILTNIIVFFTKSGL